MKLTDEQMMEVVELCCEYNPQCARCPLNDYDTCDQCMGELLKGCLDLINRKDKRIAELQLKNSELEIELKAMRGAANSYKAEVKMLKRFKDYFDDLYGIGLEVAEWHQNGMLEPFDNFYDSAIEEMVGE